MARPQRAYAQVQRVTWIRVEWLLSPSVVGVVLVMVDVVEEGS